MECLIPFKDSLLKEFECRVFKRKLVLWLRFKKNLKPKQINKESEIPLPSIYGILEKWNKYGIIEDFQHTGKPKQMSNKIQSQVIEMQKNDRFLNSMEIYRKINEKNANLSNIRPISYNQVLSVVNENFKTVTARYKITISEANKAKRLKFIEKLKYWRDSKIRDIVWTDEKVFQLYQQNKKLKVKILDGEDINHSDNLTLPKKHSGGGSIMVWGAISYIGTIYLKVFPSKIDSKFYAKFLETEAIPIIRKKMKKPFIFQQDNAPPHKGDTVRFLNNSNINVLGWPPQSPDRLKPN